MGYKLVFMVLLATCAGVGVSTVYIPKYQEMAKFKVLMAKLIVMAKLNISAKFKVLMTKLKVVSKFKIMTKFKV